MALTPGSRLGHYDVTALIGEGGMGQVWQATDTHLGRQVALKILPDAFATDPDRLARFQREAQVLASLNHPNIGSIHGLAEAGGARALVLELVNGPTLADRIAEGPIPVDDALGIARQIAAGLQAAHGAGVIHRDLKPANIKVKADGTVKILDFGLAKAVDRSPEGQPTESPTLTVAVTQMGMILGTAAYMSPEQARGARVDGRSDIWSFGVVLYEMLSARRPFTGDSTIALLSSVLKDDPPALKGLPPTLLSVLERCMAKDPVARFQTFGDLSGGLVVTAGPQVTGIGRAGPSEVPRLVVRPFKTRGSDDELNALAEGLTEDITDGLAQFSHLSVSTEGAETHPAERFAVEGTLRKSGSRARASIRLLDCESGARVWAEQFDLDLEKEDVFEAQDTLTNRIVATLADPAGVLTRSLVAWVNRKPLSHLSANECVLRTFGYMQQWRREEHASLRTAIEQAVEREPDHADVMACLSLLYSDEHSFHFNPRPGALDRALTAAQRAVELDATSQLAYRALAEAHYFRRELGAFRAAADRVLTLNPRDTSSVGMIGMLIGFSGDWKRGNSVAERGMAMNPHHAGWFHFVPMFHHYRQREYVKALEAAQRINMPGYPWGIAGMAICHAQIGNVEAARKHLNDFLKLSPKYAKFARQDLSTWFVREDHVEHVLEGLVKAGLNVEGTG